MSEYNPLPRRTMLEDRYRILKLIAQGGMGAVYSAIDTRLECPVAIKENFVQTGLTLSREDSMAQFKKEATILRALQNPHLPLVTDLFVTKDRQYLVMDFVRGQNLWEKIEAQQGPMEEKEALEIIIQICDAVIYLHEHDPQVIHRDIKPQNIIVTPAGQAKLVDFGLAKEGGVEARTSLGAAGVTPGFSPPEQYMGTQRTSPASDTYALGATLYAILTATEPPESTSLTTGWAEREPPEILNPRLSDRVCRAITQAMEIRISDRPPSVSDWQAELKALLQNLEAEVEQSLVRRRREAAQKADLYEQIQTEMSRQNWREALELGAKLQELDPDYENLAQLMDEARQALDQEEAEVACDDEPPPEITESQKEFIRDLSYDLSNFRRTLRKLKHSLSDKEKIVGFLAGLLDADEDVIRWKAALLILSIDEDEDVPDLVLKKAKSNLFKAVEIKAAKGPGFIIDRGFWQNHETCSVLSKLQEQGGKDVMDFFIEIAESDKKSKVIIAAIDGLKAFKYQKQDREDVVELFIEIAKSNKDDEIRIAAIDGLKAFKHPNIRELMVTLAQNAEGGMVRLKAIKVLRELGHEDSLKFLVKMAEDKGEGKERLKAIEFLRELGYEGSIDLYVKMARDGRFFYERFDAIKVLLDLGYEGSIDLLVDLAKTKNKTLWDPFKQRIIVLNDLRELKYKGGVDLFKERALYDDDDDVRLAALKNLHILEVDDFNEQLKRIAECDDERDDIRKYAEDWLSGK